MEKITGIYKITSPSGRIYIGSSKNIRRRFYSYKNLHCKDQPKLYNSFDCIVDAAEYENVSYSYLKGRLNGRVKNNTNYIFVDI